MNSQDFVHYKAYIKIETGWIEIDDAIVTNLSPEEEFSIRSSAYFCLYSIVDVKTSPTQQQHYNHKSGGSMQWNKQGELVDVTQAL